MHNALNAIVPPSPSVVSRQAFNEYDPDARRRAIAQLSAATFGGEKPYLALYRYMATDPDATVKAAAIKALGEHGSVEDVKVIISDMGNPNPVFLRWECAKALQKIHSPLAVKPLIEAVKDEDDDVRMAAAYALGQYADPEVVGVLIGLLDDQDFGVVEAAHQSLHTLTGQQFGTEGPAWLKWSEANRADLFTNQQGYVYMPYVQPRGFWAKMQFWKKKPPEVQPQVPAGMEATATTQAGAPQS